MGDNEIETAAFDSDENTSSTRIVVDPKEITPENLDEAADKLKTRARRLSEAKLDKTAGKIERAAKRISDAADKLRRDSEPNKDSEENDKEESNEKIFEVQEQPFTQDEIESAQKWRNSQTRGTFEQLSDFSRSNSVEKNNEFSMKFRASDESSIHTTNEARNSNENWSPQESEEDVSATTTNGSALAASLAFFDRNSDEVGETGEDSDSTIPEYLREQAASSLERSDSVEPTSCRNGVLVGESPRERSSTS